MKEIKEDKRQLELNIAKLVSDFTTKYNQKIEIDINQTYDIAAVTKKCCLVKLDVTATIIL